MATDIFFNSKHSCYLAPERLVSNLNDINYLYNLNTKMDVFSVGCVIAELFIEKPLFSYESLLKYISGSLTLENLFEAKGASLEDLNDYNLRSTLFSMLEVDPEKRIGLQDCLNFFINNICPLVFSRLFIHINTLMITKDYWKPDKKIGLLNVYFKQIIRIILKEETESLENSINPLLLQEIREDNAFKDLWIENCPLILDLTNKSLNGLKQKENEFDYSRQESIFIVLNWIITCLLNCKYSTSKISGIELMVRLSEYLPDLIKIQITLPYLIKLFQDQSTQVKIYSLMETLEMLTQIEITELPPSELKFFDCYVFPAIISNFHNTKDVTLLLIFIENISRFIELEEKFSEINVISIISLMKQKVDESLNASNFRFSTAIVSKQIDDTGLIYSDDIKEFRRILKEIVVSLFSHDFIEVRISILKQLSSIIYFLGVNDHDDILDTIITIFNRNEWQVQKQLFEYLPTIVYSLGDSSLEKLFDFVKIKLNQDKNELRIYELVHCLKVMQKLEILNTKRGMNILNLILPFIIHPNNWIRNEVFDILYYTLNKSQDYESCVFLKENLEKILTIPFLKLYEGKDLLDIDLLKENISRIIYQLKVNNIEYEFEITKDDKFCLELIELHKNICYNMANYSFSTSIKNSILDTWKRFLLSIEKDVKIAKNEIRDTLIKSTSKTISTKTTGNYDKNNIESSMLMELNLQNNFEINNLIKSLNLEIKTLNINEMNKDIDKMFDNTIEFSESINNKKYLKANKNLPSWKPSGNHLQTLYDHNNDPINYLFPIVFPNTPNNKFMSIDIKGQLFMFESTSDDFNSLVSRKIDYKINNFDNNSKAALLANNQIAIYNINNKTNINNKNQYLDIYAINSSKSQISKTNSIDIKSEEHITCLEGNSKSSKCSHLITTTDQKGCINLIDTRINSIANSNKFGMSKGILNCMTYSTNENNIYFGTNGGYIINYELRKNGIVNSWNNNSYSPIYSISTYNPKPEIEFSNTIFKFQQPEIFIISSGYNCEFGIFSKNEDEFKTEISFSQNNTNNERITFDLEINNIDKKEINCLYSKGSRGSSSINYNINSNYLNSLYSAISYQKDDVYKQSILSPLAHHHHSNRLYNTPYIFSSSDTYQIYFWDLIDCTKSYIFCANSQVYSGSYMLNENLYQNFILEESRNSFYNIERPKEDNNHTDIITQMINVYSVSIDKNVLVSSSNDGTIKLWR